jgi:hypothetical protein
MSSLGPTTTSRSVRVFESICNEMLARLSTDTSEPARLLTAQVHELLVVLGAWQEFPPSPEVRAAVISRVLDLHRTVMDHATSGHSKPAGT